MPGRPDTLGMEANFPLFLLFSRVLGTLSYCNPLRPAPGTQRGDAQTLDETVLRTLVISLRNIHLTGAFKIQREAFRIWRILKWGREGHLTGQLFSSREKEKQDT